jgi:ADP-heptose:LPS heptosyltransferase
MMNQVSAAGKWLYALPMVVFGLLHFGADSFPTHIASGYNKKIVALYSNNYVNCVKPFFGNPKDHILLEPKRNSKPTFSFEENPKTINSIKPETIAGNILNLLENISLKIK